MGGGNPIKKLTSWTHSDTIRSLTGRETGAEKEAKGQQQVALMEAKKEADMSLEERKKRMTRKDQGRASLLSGSELGVQASDLKSTLG